MNIQQLKQMAGRVRALLESASIHVGHSQALDLSAALAGLRNWPEVLAFSQRGQTVELDLVAVARLVYRLEHKHCYSITAAGLLQFLLPPAERTHANVPQVWPSGPAPGVYLATSAVAVAALIERYQEATDGEVFFAERAAADHDAAIDLGENGLWSKGLERVSSGTLIVLGPVELDQQSWQDAGARLEMACLHACNSRHRVVVLFDTPMPDQLAADATLLIVERDASGLYVHLAGMVSDQGELVPGLVGGYLPPIVSPAIASMTALPVTVVEHLTAALAGRSTGILAVGSDTVSENPGADMAEAALALTDHMGAAARIMPRHRSTMDKFDQVPPAVRQLPFLPSVESAYAQGYRRFVIDPRYTDEDTVPRFVDDSLFIACTWATCADELGFCCTGYRYRDASLLPYLIAAVAVVSVPTKSGVEVLADLYVARAGAQVADPEKGLDYIALNRTMRIEERFAALVRAGLVDGESADGTGLGNRSVRRLRALLPE